jgi:hypothetical protein
MNDLKGQLEKMNENMSNSEEWFDIYKRE